MKWRKAGGEWKETGSAPGDLSVLNPLRADFETRLVLMQDPDFKTKINALLRREKMMTSKDVDVYGEFVDSMWFGAKEDQDKGALTDRDFRIMELGLPGEVGEVLELLKKNVRDGHLDRELLKKELGDVAYYWARICSAYGLKPSEVLQANREKLEDRAKRNKLRGSGDER